MSGEPRFSVDPATGKVVQVINPSPSSPFLSPVLVPVRAHDESRKRPRKSAFSGISTVTSCSYCNKTKGCVCYRCPLCEMKSRMVVALPCACLESCFHCKKDLPPTTCSLCKKPVDRRAFLGVAANNLL